MKPEVKAELARERDDLLSEFQLNEQRQVFLRRRLAAMATLLEDDLSVDKKPQSTPEATQNEMPYDDGRSLVDLVKSVISTFKMDQEFTSQDVLAQLTKIRPLVTETSQFGPVMIRLVNDETIRVNKERRGRSPAIYQRLK